jgi:hypothetical protein
MKHALAVLQIAFDMHNTNAPIHDAEGDPEQAQLCREVAEDCREVMAMLEEITQS